MTNDAKGGAITGVSQEHSHKT